MSIEQEVAIGLEVAVDDSQGLSAAVQGGADRIELCSALDLGGLTPSYGLMREASECGRPVYAMIRPRSGAFCYTKAEIAVMCDDIAAARLCGLQGVVFGALDARNQLDAEVMTHLMGAAHGLGVTLHRAFDMINDWRPALELAIDLGVERILTSGGAASAPAGVAQLSKMLQAAAGRIIIMPGAGISALTIGQLMHLPLREVHASCSGPILPSDNAIAMGFASKDAKRTDAARVRALKSALLH